MWLVVGLGNPGKKYAQNRHNVGFMVADELRVRRGLPDFRDKFSGLLARGDETAILKPETFMNLSGDSVQPASVFFKVAASDIIVVHDELDLPFGEVRLKLSGGHAGHNGLRSILDRLGTPDFVRVRVGIGRPPPGFLGEVADFVLASFDASEKAEMPDVIARARVAVELVMADGIRAAMNVVNTKK